jgi:RNA polymerase sigma-70 factor (ECF subfamily)
MHGCPVRDRRERAVRELVRLFERFGYRCSKFPHDPVASPRCNQMTSQNEIQTGNRAIAAEARLKPLLLAGLAGDSTAYHAFLKDLSALLRGFLRGRLARMPDEVEDLVQETLLAIHNQRHTYDPSQPLTAWVHAIARYKMVDLLRRRAGREALHAPLDEELEVFASSDTDAQDARRDLEKLLAGLPERQRLPIVYVKLQGLSVLEAAQRTGMSESAVKVGIHRGLKALAALIRSRDEN